MRIRTAVSTLSLVVLGTAIGIAASPQIGSWKLNEAKSKFSGVAKNTLVVYTEAGDSVKVAIDGIDAEGKAFHSEWTGKFDGKDYAVTGDSSSDTRSYTILNANMMGFTTKKGGKAVLSGEIVVAANGKSRTVTSSGTNAKGEKVTQLAVYDKQ
jgi:hypothetical protein